MRKLVNYFYDVRRDEWLGAGLMFLLHFMLMVSLYLLKPARDSLFLSEIGPRQLPFVYLILAAVAIPISLYVSRVVQQYDTKKVLQGSLLFYMANLVVLRWLFTLQATWIFMVFYIWVGIFGILVVSQFWLYANALFDAAQSKRLFPFLNLGAILGAIAGSEGTSFFVWLVDLATENLLYLSIAALAVCWLLTSYTSRRKSTVAKSERKDDTDFTGSSAEVFRTVFKSRYLLLIAGIIGIAMLVSTLIDYQFKTLATEAFPDTAALTTFMGNFYGGMSILSLLIQIVLSAQIIKRLGLGGAVLSRPVVLLFGAILFLVEPVLASAVFLQGFNRASQYSIDKTGQELLFLPLPQQTKQKTKIFIDIFVNRFFRGIAGLMLLLFIFVQELTVQQISYVVTAAIVCWIALGVWARRAYVNKFRNSLQKRYIDRDRITLNLNESVAHQSVKEMLESDSPTRVIYGLRLIEDSQADKLEAELTGLLAHDHAEVRLQALKLLQNVSSDDATSKVELLLHDPVPDIRLEAVYYLCSHSSEDPEKAIQHYLEHDDDKLKSAALGCVHRHSEGEGPEVEEAFIKKVVNRNDEGSVVIRAQMAQLLGYVPDEEKAVRYLKKLLKSDEQVIVREALKSIRRVQSDTFLEPLFGMLKHPDFTTEVQKVLASYGVAYFDRFGEVFNDDSVELEIRRRIPGIFSQLHEQESVDFLTGMLQQSNPALRYHVIKALNNLNKYAPSLVFDKEKIREVLQAEARQYFQLLSIKRVQRTDIPNNILIIALKEKMEQAVERLFRLAGLLNDQQDMYGSYLALVSGDREANAASIEFIDNVLENEDKKYIFPIVDNPAEEVKLAKGRELFELPVNTYEEGMLKLMEGDDLWLRACAIFSVSQSCPPPLQQHVRRSAVEANSPLIKETAEYVLKRNRKA